jgi:hypothetical protein
VEVAEAAPAERAGAVEGLAAHILDAYGAPGPDAARAAAEEEIAFAESLCDGHPPGTVLALARSVEEGAVRERFRTLHRRDGPPPDRTGLPVFGVVEVEGEDEPPEHVDLAALAPRRTGQDR